MIAHLKDYEQEIGAAVRVSELAQVVHALKYCYYIISLDKNAIVTMASRAIPCHICLFSHVN